MVNQSNDLLTRRLPRYTSYPTAPHFHDGIGEQDDRVRRALIERVMCDMAVNIDRVAGRFGYSVKDFPEEVDSLHQLRRDGLIDFENGAIRIPPENRILVRIVASVFDRYLRSTETEAKHAIAV